MLNTLAQTTVSTTTAAAAGTGMLIYQVVALAVSVALAVLAYKKQKLIIPIKQFYGERCASFWA